MPDVVVYLEALDRYVVGRKLRRIRVVGISLLKSFDPPVSAAEGRRLRGLITLIGSLPFSPRRKAS